MFIDFEGIDGSGKTTLLEVVAGKLEALGISVYNTRRKGEYKSRIGKALRKVSRSPKNLGLLPWAEFLVYMARDAQVFEERILPHLSAGNAVIADRFFYSHVLLAAARGLPVERTGAIMEQVSGGVLPDLVVYCDVDIHTSRVRKKIADIIEYDDGDFGRKGLTGIGVRNRMRGGFLELAESDPDRWVTVENVGVTQEDISEYVWQVVSKKLAEKGLLKTEEAASEIVTPKVFEPKISAGLELPEDVDKLVGEFYAILDKYVDVDDRISAYHINGVDMPQADRLRGKLKEKQPTIIAYGLQNVNTDTAWALRRELAEREPRYVARSLAGMPLEGDALDLRMALKDVVPKAVAKSLKDFECETSINLRRELFDTAPEGVLMSLKGFDTDWAWELRNKCGKKFCAEALAESLSKIDTPKAWKIRKKLLGKNSAWVLRGLGPLESDEAWDLREKFVDIASKLIARSLNGLDSDRAHDMRERIGDLAKDVLDSLKKLESPRAWEIREKLKDVFPSTAVSSLGKLNDSEKAWAFREKMAACYPGDLLLLKHIVESLWRTGKL
ncbi:MAG: thymidylate kinase [Planctomycetota bacterium]|nr:MAG: thymidylate kinase [Planctomycetota bacterium]